MATVMVGPFPKKAETAQEVIRLMLKWKDQRRIGRTSRGQFLGGWSALRQRLAATVAYHKFVRLVRERAGGRCQSAGCTALGTVAHHLIPVAIDPTQALSLRNARWLCHPCHANIHPHLKVSDGQKDT